MTFPPHTLCLHKQDLINVLKHLLYQVSQCMYKRNIEARSRNRCYCGKIIKYYKYCVCVCSPSYPACDLYSPYYIVICGVSVYTIFFHNIYKAA